MNINELLNYIITNRTIKPNKNTINMFKTYLESCEQDNISMDQIMNEFNSGLIYSHHNNNDMSKLTFTDGETFDLSGPLRLEKRADGWYVLGENRMMAVNDVNEGKKYIEYTNYQLELMRQSDNYNFINN